MRRSHLTAAALVATAVLAGCTSASDVLEPSAIARQQTQSTAGADAVTATPLTAPTTPGSAPGPAQPATAGTGQAAPPAGSTPAASTSSAPAAAQTAAVAGKARLQIAPLVGASVEAATPLTERLAARIRERGMTLAGSTGQAPTHVLKGYFSALTEGKDTTVIYVWDIYDPAGNRLHRINGQQKAPSVNGAEGWAAVSPATMQTIADSTLDQLAGWLSGRAG